MTIELGDILVPVEILGLAPDVGNITVQVDILGINGASVPVKANPRLGLISVGVAIAGPHSNPIPRLSPYALGAPVDGVVAIEAPPEHLMYASGYRSFGSQLHRAVNDVGSGQASFRDDVVPSQDDVIELVVGSRVMQSIIAEQSAAVFNDPGEESAVAITYSGPGYAAELGKVRILPDLGAEDPTRLGAPAQKTRFFDWTASTGIDDTLWDSPVITEPYYGGQPGTLTAQRFTRPVGLPWDETPWIAPMDASGAIPIGDFYLRASFQIPSGVYNVFVFANDEHETWIDGVKVCERTGFYNGQMEKATITLTGNHFHFIAARATNRGGRGGYGLVIMPVNDTSVNGEAIVLTGVAGWKVLGYPTAPPGMTAGKILGIAKAEAQVRSAWPGWELMFSDTHDSAGQPWETLYGVGVEVGTSFLDLLGQLGETDFDWVASPTGRQLYCYRKGNLPGHQFVLDSIAEYQIQMDSNRCIDSLLVQYDGDDGNIYLGSGGREGYVTLSGVKDRSKAIELGLKLLEIQLQPRTTYTISPLPYGEGGLEDVTFDLGDRYGLFGGPSLRELTITEDDEGKVTILPGLTDPLDLLEAQIDRILARYAAGANDGSLLAGDGRPTKPPTAGTGIEYPIDAMGCHGFLSNLTAPLGPFVTERPCSISRFYGNLRVAGTTATVIRLQVNGDNVSATTIPAGETYWSHRLGSGGILMLAGDSLTYEVETAGVGAQGLVIHTNASVA